MSSNSLSPSGIDPTSAGRPSYEAFLRIKQGIGNDALRAAGLPSVENLSYDAYVTALNRKAAEARANTPVPDAAAPAEEKAGRKSAAWTGLVVGPVLIAFVILLAGILKDRPGEDTISGGTEAVASSLTSDGLPVALNITATEDMLGATLPVDADPSPPPSFDAVAADPAIGGEALAAAAASEPKVELLTTKPVAAKKKKAAAAAKEAAAAPVMPVPERRTPPAQKKQTAATQKSTKTQKSDDFWQPLVDLLDGKGVRGTNSAPPQEDRVGR